MTYLNDFWRLILWLYVPIIIIAAILIPIRFKTKIPDYIFRKILHICAFIIVFPLTLLSNTWWITEIVIGVTWLLIVIALLIMERFPFYQKLFVEKNRHEVLIDITLFFLIIAGTTGISWGVLGEKHKYLTIMAIMAWGPGDAMAAIIGIRYGRHHYQSRYIDSNKTVEGTVSNILATLASTLIVGLIFSPAHWALILITCLTISLICPFVELISRKGLDNIFVPLVAFGLLYLLLVITL